MLSGPDLGGGYLHQLTIDRDGESTTFTYHAQDGGSDAGGPPKGPLDAFGYIHPAAACQFGGRSCWHRRFLLPFGEIPRVRATYNRSRFVLEASLAQRYDRTPPEIESALTEVVGQLSSPLEAEGVPWYVGGWTAAWMLGANTEPTDIRLGTTRAGIDRLAALLKDYLVEPAAPTDWPSHGLVHGARAFVGTFQRGARVEWGVTLDPESRGGPDAEYSGHIGEIRTLRAERGALRLLVSRPEYSLVRAWESSEDSRAAALGHLVREIGPDRELLAALVEHSKLEEPVRQARLRAFAV